MSERLIAGFEAREAALGADTRERYHTLAQKITADARLEPLSYALEPAVMAAMLDTLPVELSFVDADDTVRYFSQETQDKIFPRQRSALGMGVENCQPSKSVHMVKQIIADFKAGSREAADRS